MIDFECQFGEMPGRRRKRRKSGHAHATHLVMPQDPADIEMGIFPLLAAAIPMVTSLAGSLLGKKTKGGGPPPEANQAQNVLDILTKAVGGDESKGETNIKEVVANLIKSIPPPVMAQVKDGIKQIKNAESAAVQGRATLVNAIDSKFGPQVHALLAAMKAQQMQTQATYEHQQIAAKQAFRTNTTAGLKDLQQRLCRIEDRLGSVAIVSGKRIDLFGGRGLERS